MPKAQEAGWSSIDWTKVQYKVTKLQKKIYQAAGNNDQDRVVMYQQMLIESYNAKLLAVKRVTQDNRGKATAGVDGKKLLSPRQRLELANELELDGKAEPLKRVEIAKENGTLRLLGIPTIKDRAKQALAKMALEPEWEAYFEPNSYGFRPGRGCHDAIEAIELAIRRRTKYILEADIKGCFDNIEHNYLLRRVKTFPKMENQIRAWLKSGVLKGDVFYRTEKGTPQGGVISPLLANIALHGLETHIKEKYPTSRTRKGMPEGKQYEMCEARLVRYADDFVIIHEKLDVIEQSKKDVAEWLKGAGLTLSEKRTRICHTLEKVGDEEPGFDFLGFNIRTFHTGKYKSNNNCSGEKLMMVTRVRPSGKSCRKFLDKVKVILEKGHTEAPAIMIKRLNWLITGWANYFRTGSHSNEEFGKLQSQLYNVYLNWGKKRMSKKGLGFITKKIFHKSKVSNWTFGWKEGGKVTLSKMLYEFKYYHHSKVEGTKTPYDGDWVYWLNRMGKHPETPKDLSAGLKRQEGKCDICKGQFGVEDRIEIHHIDGNRNNNRINNKVLVHNHCHGVVHTRGVQDL